MKAFAPCLLAGSMLVMACGSPPTGPDLELDAPTTPPSDQAPKASNVPDLSGRWQGQITGLGVKLVFELMQRDAAVNGLGELTTPVGVFMVKLKGDIMLRGGDPPAVAFDLTLAGGQRIEGEAVYMNSVMYLKLHGAGFKGGEIIMSRQR